MAAKHFIWPQSNGRPMAFLAQIDLAEIAQEMHYEWLNDKGLLLFFYDILEMPWGFDPKDRGKWQVLFQENPDAFAELPEGLDEIAKIKEAFISGKRMDILPDCDDPVVEGLQLTAQEIDLYCDLNSDEANAQPLHQVGGFPSPVQGGDMALQCQLAANGIDIGDSRGCQSDQARALQKGSQAWRLLLQFDSDDDLDVIWGDAGMLYFWVEKDQAKNNRFENCWLILQCC